MLPQQPRGRGQNRRHVPREGHRRINVGRRDSVVSATTPWLSWLCKSPSCWWCSGPPGRMYRFTRTQPLPRHEVPGDRLTCLASLHASAARCRRSHRRARLHCMYHVGFPERSIDSDSAFSYPAPTTAVPTIPPPPTTTTTTPLSQPTTTVPSPGTRTFSVEGAVLTSGSWLTVGLHPTTTPIQLHASAGTPLEVCPAGLDGGLSDTSWPPWFKFPSCIALSSSGAATLPATDGLTHVAFAVKPISGPASGPVDAYRQLHAD